MMVELHQIIYNVFGKKNYITTFCWKKRASGSNQSKFCAQQHDYILAVAKNIKKCKWNVCVPQIEGQDSSSEFNQHGASREKGNNNNKYPLYIEGVDKLHPQERSAGDVNKGYGISKNTSFPMYINEGLVLSQSICNVTNQPEKRQYPMYINDVRKDSQRLDKVQNGKKPGNKTKFHLSYVY